MVVRPVFGEHAYLFWFSRGDPRSFVFLSSGCHINLISQRISCAPMWVRKNDGCYVWAQLKTPIPRKRRWMESVSIAGTPLAAVEEDGLTLALRAHLSVSLFSANTTSFLLSRPVSLTRMAHALHVLCTRSMWNKVSHSLTLAYVFDMLSVVLQDIHATRIEG